ncbi:hypothetical protein MPTK1_7g09920 [Marchantia polymorpha subsp. ruderalis]|uniref:Uncharacterized protein n=2 Tax=Marchantia polymorpha TaxID=3197 RepID=A0AAF6BXX6_MARPO|nr:hypothetical protein MARPO_0003s0011 [Marchantia polymorpha]BBN16860.1 hypothetical protein Mp_7g09920 [Marchantia polymorpha subsp. ruderalis]|eukprot:PTQ49100.1 hypothetical protein MARPO_0003s0011 [Marchantia polymorpha]
MRGTGLTAEAAKRQKEQQLLERNRAFWGSSRGSLRTPFFRPERPLFPTSTFATPARAMPIEFNAGRMCQAPRAVKQSTPTTPRRRRAPRRPDVSCGGPVPYPDPRLSLWRAPPPGPRSSGVVLV